MREIIFRGKTTLEGTWVYGDLNQFSDGRKCIVDSEMDWCRVDPETVGQYTGLKDRNGKKIFEGDIIKYIARLDEEVRAEIKFGLYDANDGKYNCGFYADWYNDEMLRQHLAFWTSERDVEVVGNIYDKPAGGTDNA